MFLSKCMMCSAGWGSLRHHSLDHQQDIFGSKKSYASPAKKLSSGAGMSTGRWQFQQSFRIVLDSESKKSRVSIYIPRDWRWLEAFEVESLRMFKSVCLFTFKYISIIFCIFLMPAWSNGKVISEKAARLRLAASALVWCGSPGSSRWGPMQTSEPSRNKQLSLTPLEPLRLDTSWIILISCWMLLVSM